MNLAEAVVEAVARCKGKYNPTYDWESSIEDKINALATKIYGADGVEYSLKAKNQLRRINQLGMDKLPICMAKTQKSLSDNDKLIGRPTGFLLNVREFEFAAGAGFIIPVTGAMLRMPGLPATPAAEGMDIDDNGVISGLS